MRSSLQRADTRATETDRTDVQAEERLFGSCMADVARLLWPTKTAAHVAAIVGCTERAAEFWLAGDRDWSGDAIAAIVGEILKRHATRNVRVRSR